MVIIGDKNNSLLCNAEMAFNQFLLLFKGLIETLISRKTKRKN